MKQLLTILFLMPLLWSCLSDAVSDSGVSSQRASEQGVADAAALCNDSISFTTHELHGIILAVRAREWQMRSGGDNSAADAYIAAFQKYLTENNSTLASEIF